MFNGPDQRHAGDADYFFLVARDENKAEIWVIEVPFDRFENSFGRNLDMMLGHLSLEEVKYFLFVGFLSRFDLDFCLHWFRLQSRACGAS